MVVRLDEGMVAGSVDGEVLVAAERLLAAGAVGQISQVGGGVTATVHGAPDAPSAPSFEAWVGVFDGGVNGECDCALEHDTASEDLCVHALALTLQAVRDGFTWSSAATPPSAAVDDDPRITRLTALAERVPHHRLADLVAAFAATDRRLEARLLAEAGEPDPPAEDDGLARPAPDELTERLDDAP